MNGKHWHFIDGIKGMLIIWIVLFHYTTRFNEIYGGTSVVSFNNGARVGVALFFFISGLLTQLTITKLHSIGVKKWLTNKIFRIYPMYAFACIWVFLSLTIFGLQGRDGVSSGDLIKNILLFPVFGYDNYIEGAHWYVITLIKFYILYSLVAYFKLNEKKWFFITVLFILGFYSFINTFDYFQRLKRPLGIVLLNGHMLPILFGSVFMNCISTRDSKWIVIAVGYLALSSIVIHPYYFIIFIILFSLLFNDSILIVKKTKRILESRFLLFLGTISYSWYLIHQNIGYQIMKNITIKSTQYVFLIPLFGTFLMAVIINILVENNISIFFNRIRKFILGHFAGSND